MEMEIQATTDEEIMVVDYGWCREGEIIVKSIKDWCKEFIEIMEYKINQDLYYEEMVEDLKKDIKQLKILGKIQ